MKKLKILILAIVLVIMGTVSYLFATGTVNQLRPVVVQDIGGYPMIGVNAPKYIDARVLAANIAESHTVPTGAKYVLFSATTSFYVSYSGTAAVPSGDIINGTGSELNPMLRSISGVSSISLISSTSCIVIMSFFK